MQSRFNPYDPADLRKQAALYRKLAAVTNKPEVSAKLKAMAAEYEKRASDGPPSAPPEPSSS